MRCSHHDSLDSLHFSGLSLLAVIVLITSPASPAQLASNQVVEKAAPSVALVLIGKSPAQLDSVGSAMIA
jgi:hypothetical protein